MLPTNTIRHLTRKEINIDKWNDCIAKAANGLIYSYSFYLDALCDNWDALVFEDYNIVMPLPWRKKAGIYYLYAVPFIQQLGMTGEVNEINHEAVFLEIKKKFKYGDLFFNHSNSLPFAGEEKTNFILPLYKPFSETATQFSTDLKQNLKTISPEEFLLSPDQSFEMAIALFKNNYRHRMPHISESSYQKFSRLSSLLLQKKMLLTRAVVNRDKEILAIALLLVDNKRIYNLMNTTTPKGRKAKANHFLLSEIIKEFSEKNLLFDFEGSDVPGVKEFYKNFGPVNQPYFHLHFNNLPFPLNLIKKNQIKLV